MRKLIIALFALAALTLIYSCANRGAGPQGGPRDFTPPQVVRYSPADGSTHMTRKRIEITFDEIVVLKNPGQKVVVSPPQKTPADIKAVSHKVIIEFADSLLDSTTYSVDFTDAIVDNNEGNVLDGFTYSFSTGDRLDSLEISGRVLHAENLNPCVGIIVGVHSVTTDSAFTKHPFSRISKTNERGEFVIRNLPTGCYSVFALSDIGGNFLKDIPGEEIAFLDTSFIPTRTFSLRHDTIHIQKGDSIVDSVLSSKSVITTPDNLLLFSFVELDDRRFFVKAQRPDRYRLLALFTGTDSLLPSLQPLNFPDSLFSHVVTYNEKRDSVTFWLRDTSLWSQDTLSCLLTYSRRDIDSSFVASDTVSFIFRSNMSKTRNNANKAKNTSRSGHKDKTKEKKTLPKLATSNGSRSFDIYNPFIVRFAMPTDIHPHDSVSYHLQHMKDSLWVEIPEARLEKVDSSGTAYSITHDWEPLGSYRLLLDSSLLLNMVGRSNGLEMLDFTVKSLEDYSKLILHLSGVTGHEVVQLLDPNDKVVRQIPLATLSASAPGKFDVTFEYITPGVYYMRLFSDDNGDAVWTPGLYSAHRQPEKVVYFPYDIELRAFWDVEEDWSPYTTTLSKPKELIKDKPIK